MAKATRSKILQHPLRDEIDAALGIQSTREVARRFDLTEATLRRYKSSAWSRLSIEAEERCDALATQNSAEIVAKQPQPDAKRRINLVMLVEKLEVALDATEKGIEDGMSGTKKKWPQILASVRELRETAKAIAVLVIRQDEQESVYIGRITDHPDWVATRTRMIAALAAHPEAVQALIEAESVGEER